LTGCQSDNSPSSVTGREGKDKPLELSFFLPASGNAVLNDGDFVKQTIEQRFNVRIEVTTVPASKSKEKLNLLIASGNTPDLFVTDGRSSLDYNAMGIIGDLSELMNPNVMPNYFRWITQKEVNAFSICRRLQPRTDADRA
jgi:ABC-type glycerol-3-phosphate transport system substrate-binding protein